MGPQNQPFWRDGAWHQWYNGVLHRWDGKMWLKNVNGQWVNALGYDRYNAMRVYKAELANSARAAQFYGPRKIVTKTHRDTSHTFHLIMTILTLGFWGVFVWLPITILHAIGPRKKSVTYIR